MNGYGADYAEQTQYMLLSDEDWKELSIVDAINNMLRGSTNVNINEPDEETAPEIP